jgi:hypothetical protein
MRRADAHICAESRRGRFWVRRITISKRMRAKLKEVGDQLRKRRHQPIPEQGRWLASVVRGHMAYYAVPGNTQAVAGVQVRADLPSARSGTVQDLRRSSSTILKRCSTRGDAGSPALWLLRQACADVRRAGSRTPTASVWPDRSSADVIVLLHRQVRGCRVWQPSVVNGSSGARSRGRVSGPGGSRRTGVMALALLVGTAAAALVLARSFHLGVAAAVVAILGGLPGLYLSWAGYRGAGGGEGLSLATVADELAVAVGAQWRAEAAVRRLNDPYPLPVRWVAAARHLVDRWNVLVTLATNGAGWPSPPRPDMWAAGPDDLAGGFDRDLPHGAIPGRRPAAGRC